MRSLFFLLLSCCLALIPGCKQGKAKRNKSKEKAFIQMHLESEIDFATGNIISHWVKDAIDYASPVRNDSERRARRHYYEEGEARHR